MSNYFLHTFWACALTLALVLGYEALFPYIPALKNFQSPHFWTPYSDSLSANDELLIDTNMTVEMPDSIALDSLSADSIQTPEDSLAAILDSLALSQEDSLILANLENFTGMENLAGFFQKLQEVRQGKRKRVRIMYYGDSTTEGDLIVGDLRDMLQRIFGGRGVGYVSIAPHGTGFRRTIRQAPSSNWEMVNYFRKVKNPEFQFGISGDYSASPGASMNQAHKISFKPSWGGYPTMSVFEKAYLFYGRGSRDSSNIYPRVYATINGTDTFSADLNGNAAVNRIVLSETASRQVDLAFEFPNPFPIFGLSFESENGVIVDNFGKRNDSGSHLTRIPSEVMKQFYDYLGCDLVILHFGANVLHHRTDYSYYEPILMAGIRHFQQNMGNVPVLVIGSTDRVAKIGGQEKTTPAVYGLIKSQKVAAAKTHNAFLDLFERMGGEGTMLRWYKENPSKVAPDYVHFSSVGAKSIADIVFDYLMEGYENYSHEKIRYTKPGLLDKIYQEHLQNMTLK